MKNALLIVLLVTTILFGGLFAYELKKSGAARSALTEAERRAAAEADRAAQLEKRAKDLSSRLARAEADAANASLRASQAEQSTARVPRSAPAPAPAPAEPAPEPAKKKTGLALLGEIFNDPDMREMMRSQRKAFGGPAVDSVYGNYLKQLNLPPEQADKLKELLKAKMGVANEAGLNFLTGDMTPEKQKELAAAIKEQTDGYNQQIRQLLGDRGYAQLEYFEKSQPERQSLSGFKQQLPTAAALSPAQEQQLAQVMFDERQNFKFTTDFYDQQQVPRQTLGAILTEENLATFAREQEQLDQRRIVAARRVLTPEQLGPFERHLNTSREMQLNMIRVGAKMFRGLGGGGGNP